LAVTYAVCFFKPTDFQPFFHLDWRMLAAIYTKILLDLKDGWIKNLIFKGLDANCFHNHFALTIFSLFP